MAAPSEPPVQMDLADIQGDILRAYGNDYDNTTYAFVHIECPPEQARAWFSGVVDHVTTAEPWPKGEKPRTTLNVSVTAEGLRALGVSDDVVDIVLEGVSQRHGHALGAARRRRAERPRDVGGRAWAPATRTCC